MSGLKSVAIIGAGLAGLSCAQRLHDRGWQVRIFEKSRGLGGRLATRRGDGFQFDHGAQYLTSKSAPFADLLNDLMRRGAADLWTPQAQATETKTGDAKRWFVGLPGMSGLVRPIAERLDIAQGVRIVSLQKNVNGWALIGDDDSRHDNFDAVVITAPAPQAHELLAAHDPAFEALADVVMAPCWAGLFAFDEAIGIVPDVIRAGSNPIAWAARDCTKPGRLEQPESWVVHASPDWSRDHLEEDKEQIASALLDAFRGLTEQERLPSTRSISAHRWRYALVEKPLGKPFLQSADGSLMAAGDWCLAPRAEAAFESGIAAADVLLHEA